MSKRAIFAILAKEDAKRHGEDQPSVTSLLASRPEFKSFCDMVEKKRQPSQKEPHVHIKSVDAWMRRVGGLTVKELTDVVDVVVGKGDSLSSSPPDITTPKESVEDKSEENDTQPSEDVFPPAGTRYNVPQRDVDASSNVSFRSSSSSTNRKHLGNHRENIDSVVHMNASTVVEMCAHVKDDDVMSTTLSNASSRHGSRCGAAHTIKEEKKRSDSVVNASAPSTVNTNAPNHDDARDDDVMSTLSSTSSMNEQRSSVSRCAPSTASKQHSRNSNSASRDDVSTLSDFSNDLSTISENDINNWYHLEMTTLDDKMTTLRSEQYKRKKAELRVEYWRRLDVARNNACPTVVNMV